MILGEQTIRNRQFLKSLFDQFQIYIGQWLAKIESRINKVTVELPKITKVKVVKPVEVRGIDKLTNIKSETRNLRLELKALKDKLPSKQDSLNNVISSVKKVENAVNKISIPEYKDDKVVKAITGMRDTLQDSLDILPDSIKIPPQEKTVFPSQMSLAEAKPIISGIQQVQKSLDLFSRRKEKVDLKPILTAFKSLEKKIGKIKIETSETEFPDSISVNNFPVQKYPSPVTNININPLRGFVKTTSTTVTTTLTTLPGYGVLANRRTLIVFNNSGNMLYIGGSDVTVSNGMPVPPRSFSPALDLGIRMVLYGVVAAGSADVRVTELSNSAIGG